MRDFELGELLELHRAGGVQRYHTEPVVIGDRQTNASHQWGVAALILALHPDPSLQLVRSALSHDLGERVIGDVPHPGKRAFPALREMLDRCEEEAMAARPMYRLVSGHVGDLTSDEYTWLRGCDYLEACLYMFEQRVGGNRYFDESFYKLAWEVYGEEYPEPLRATSSLLRTWYGERGYGCETNKV